MPVVRNVMLASSGVSFLSTVLVQVLYSFGVLGQNWRGVLILCLAVVSVVTLTAARQIRARERELRCEEEPDMSFLSVWRWSYPSG
jgi:hypothetical protein